MNGVKFFTTLELSQAYHHLELDEASRSVTTFRTHLGLYRYKRLNFGTCVASEIFQCTLKIQLQGRKGVKNIADDIVVIDQTRKEHDEKLDKCLARLNSKRFTLNKDKCTCLSDTLEYFEQVFRSTRHTPIRNEFLIC